ncbi:uncharacterized protein LOC101845038 [Aplysia californica]|uniref:Uncharacterized protein LOC101845038 n=1 Tax=Aplysia californica TaxID=6500 RepID=A0ABM1AA63_APLCA|nr:uncharacterized protein LOC101845038 [Aplysia californica]
MAQGDAVMKPTVVTEEVSLSEIQVKLLVDGVIPPLFGSKKKPKNGDLAVTFFKRGFEMLATVHKTDGKETKWHFAVKKLPSEIVINRSSFKVDKGLVIVNLYKKDELSWAPMLRRGIEQADSDSSDEEADKQEKTE